MEIESLEKRYEGDSGIFVSLENEEGHGAAKSIEGWLIFMTGIHEEV
eukprot:CAMPEP_0117036656 /NCGR_PEP_ID=MMETSP0472-20121206/25941_1 /TAXON_ID=693140 ORGANISM="Tiarina fusus, Strain LIS" /NCGR_SAMPLE_ID=MMETSP0472 /ASSEMBLY_ACC=CAM_ASM_000603 /LENGTH=46 /DNA_ID= /DNA_START= /DNA_END= /DNA_ORIENTATION=